MRKSLTTRFLQFWRREDAADEGLEERVAARILLKRHPLLSLSVVASQILGGFAEAGILTVLGRLAILVSQGASADLYFPGFGRLSLSLSIGLLCALILLRFFLAMASEMATAQLNNRIIAHLRMHSLRRYVSASASAQMSFGQGRMHQLIVELPNSIGNSFSGLIASVGSISMLVSMLVYASLTDVRLTAALGILILAVTAFFRPLRKRIKGVASSVLRLQRETTSGVSEITELCVEANAFGVEREILKSLESSVRSEAHRSTRLSALKGSVLPIYTMVSYLAVVGGLAVLAQNDGVSLERTGPVLLVVLRALSHAQAVQSFGANLASLDPGFKLLEASWRDLLKFPAIWGDREVGELKVVETVGASFFYEHSAVPALTDVTISIDQGSKFGLVGRSGSGKSTLTLLMLGLFDPREGDILVNGVPLREIGRDVWKSKTAFVPQVTHILEGTVRENISFFRSGINDAKIWDALERADLDADVRSWEDALDTRLGAGRRGLSGGQQQRLAIARALVGDPEIIFMDEPTSSVDVVSEGLIADALDDLSTGVTLVIASHRKRILRGCDRIALMESGRVVAVGAPSELLEDSGFLSLLDLE